MLLNWQLHVRHWEMPWAEVASGERTSPTNANRKMESILLIRLFNYAAASANAISQWQSYTRSRNACLCELWDTTWLIYVGCAAALSKSQTGNCKRRKHKAETGEGRQRVRMVLGLSLQVQWIGTAGHRRRRNRGQLPPPHTHVEKRGGADPPQIIALVYYIYYTITPNFLGSPKVTMRYRLYSHTFTVRPCWVVNIITDCPTWPP